MRYRFTLQVFCYITLRYITYPELILVCVPNLTSIIILIPRLIIANIFIFILICDDSTPFVRRVAGLNPVLAAIGTLGKSFIRSCLWRVGVTLRHSIRALSGAPLSSSG